MSQAARRGERRRADLLATFADRDAIAAPPEVLDLDRLRDCLEQLPERERTIVALTFYAERDGDSIASELGMKPGNVRVARHRALARLHDCVTGGAA
jgi:RNA polymerase sigma-70 factor (ECF subfamily)